MQYYYQRCRLYAYREQKNVLSASYGREYCGGYAMINSSQTPGRNERWFYAVAAVVVLLVGGCGDYFAEKSAELEADKTLRMLTQIKPVAEPNISIPEIYKAPPKVIKQTVGGNEEWKLFYFCKYHVANHLKDIVFAQFATPLFNKKQANSQADYTISANDATNQLIVRSPTEDDINAILETLESIDIPPIQVKIDCIISKLYADVTMDRETTIQIDNLFGEGIAMGGKVDSSGNLLPAFPGAALRDIARSKFGLKVGFSRGGTDHKFQTLVDILESKGYLKILMNPSLEVVNGQNATITSQETVPLQTLYLRDIRSEFIETRTEYVQVIDKLDITPHVFADGSIGLVTKARIASKSTPEGVKQIPVLTHREIDNKENRIRPGESLIIGGIRKSERRAVVRGIPGLKDIPLLGMLFSSKDFEERATETIFIITPTISTGGMPNKEMVDKLKRDHEPPLPTETLNKTMTDPFGMQANKREQERELLDAEAARLDAAREKAIARSVMRAADDKAERAEAEAAKAMLELRKVKTEALQMKADAEKARTDAEAQLKAAQATKAAADKATTEATQAKTDAQKQVDEAQKAKAEAEAKSKAAEKTVADAEAKAKAAQEALDKSKAEADSPEPKTDTPEEKTDETKQSSGSAQDKTEEPKQDSPKPNPEKPTETEPKAGSNNSKPDQPQGGEGKRTPENPKPETNKPQPDQGKPEPGK